METKLVDKRTKSEQRFCNNISKVETEYGCLEWKLSCDTGGYGKVTFKGKKFGAHRIAFEIFHKRLIVEGMCILHSCDNRKCCNPIHLSEGTHQDNMTDMVLKNRQTRGETNASSKLTETQVLEIRKKYADGGYTHRSLATEYNVGDTAISNIIHRERWVHI